MLIHSMKLLVSLGYTNPKGGNGSIRVDDRRILITPSGIPKHLLKTDDLVLYDIINNSYIGKYKPSIEVNAHAKTYRVRNDIHAILHAHLPLATSLTDIGLENWWLAGTVEAEYSLGKVYVSEYAPPGSLELAEKIAEGFRAGAKIVIVPRHGVFAGGKDVADALDSIIALESTAKYVYVKVVVEELRNIKNKVLNGST
ncbi:class II aldolase/adducin family protein [Staphylothermus hellenicus DSM 12710]|uniref:Class II aldolase/adducin family protein n=2 Tax=Staphylothermus hellenicus TaxID=84599 RepID=D7D9E9_STAHD|nr:class II aldolase/adducin family protein [Staphylothermus hellenicus DSM 12710]